MAYIIKQNRNGGLAIVKINSSQLMNFKTLIGWEAKNPKVWGQIKEFVYRKGLNHHSVSFKTSKIKTIKTTKKKRFGIFG